MTEQVTTLCDLGIVGLAVMGSNLALNFASHGFRVAVWDRDTQHIARFIASQQHNSPLANRLVAAASPHDFVLLVSRCPVRRIFLLVRAGAAVDDVISLLLQSALSPGDVIVDCGNSHFRVSERRCAALESAGFRFCGCGVSGGEMGARHGPALMPGGTESAWPLLRPLFETIAARVNSASLLTGRCCCCAWMGGGGAGHYVKMLHNGIEYAEMQLIAETWHFLHDAARLTNEVIAAVFRFWASSASSRHRGYLVEITADILSHNRGLTVEMILDCARQKGTGAWQVQDALELSGTSAVSASMVAEAVFARCLSSHKAERIAASKTLDQHLPVPALEAEESIAICNAALAVARIVAYSQAFSQLAEAKRIHPEWSSMDFASVASTWSSGCIIRSALLCDIHAALSTNSANYESGSLLDIPPFRSVVCVSVPALRRFICESMIRGIPIPVFSAALSHIDMTQTTPQTTVKPNF